MPASADTEQMQVLTDLIIWFFLAKGSGDRVESAFPLSLILFPTAPQTELTLALLTQAPETSGATGQETLLCSSGKWPLRLWLR